MSRTEILSDAIIAAANQSKASEHEYLTAFLGITGNQYDHELMLVGRAVNGWHEWSPHKVQTGVMNSLEVSKAVIEPSGRCPLAWVCEGTVGVEHNAKRSAFWRTALGVLDRVAPRDMQGCWASRLAWSNLYKLSGRELNPPGWLSNSQFEACKRILDLEISEFAPRRVLFSTGWGWARWFVPDFAEPDAIALTGKKPLEAYGRLRGGDGSPIFVVAPHPQGKSEAEWVSAVVDGFAAAERM